MLIGIDPIVVSVGGLAVRWSGLLALAGLGAAIWLSLRALDRRLLGRRQALDALAWALPVGVLMAWLVHVLAYWDYYLTALPQLWRLNLDGLALWGGLVGGGLVAAARLKRDALRRRRVLDAIVPFVALGIAVGRLGQFLDGHGQGLPSSLPWATQYANPLAASPDFGVTRHPAQVYDGLVALGLCGLLLALPRSWPAGLRAAVFLVGYGAARVALGAVRLDPAFVFGLQIEQLLALGAIGVGVVYGLRPVAHSALADRGQVNTGVAAKPRRNEDSVAA